MATLFLYEVRHFTVDTTIIVKHLGIFYIFFYLAEDVNNTVQYNYVRSP